MPLRAAFQQRPSQFGQAGASSQRVGISLGAQFGEQMISQWHGLLQPPFEPCLAFPPDQRIRVFAFGQQQKTDLPAVAQERQRHFKARVAAARPARSPSNRTPGH